MTAPRRRMVILSNEIFISAVEMISTRGATNVSRTMMGVGAATSLIFYSSE